MDEDECEGPRDLLFKDENEKVGYKRPPKAHQFKKGRSGNPRGRRKGSKSFETLVREELSKKVQVKTNGKVKSLSVAQALLMRTLREGISGSRRAADQGIRLMEKYGLFDDSDVANYDLKRLTREEFDEFGRLFHKALGLVDEWQDELSDLRTKAEAERARIFGPRTLNGDDDAEPT